MVRRFRALSSAPQVGSQLSLTDCVQLGHVGKFASTAACSIWAEAPDGKQLSVTVPGWNVV